MAIRPELHFRLPNSPRALASVIAALDDERIRVLALSVEHRGDARLIVDNVERAFALLAQRHIRAEKHNAIVTTVAPRSVGTLLESVASAGVNVEYAYMSSADQDGMVAVVLGVDDAVGAAAKTGL